MSPSTRARFGERANPALETLREVATTLWPRPRKAWTTAAPMPREAPVTMTVLLLAIVKLRCFGQGHQAIQPGVSFRVSDGEADLCVLRHNLRRVRAMKRIDVCFCAAGRCWPGHASI